MIQTKKQLIDIYNENALCNDYSNFLMNHYFKSSKEEQEKFRDDYIEKYMDGILTNDACMKFGFSSLCNSFLSEPCKKSYKALDKEKQEKVKRCLAPLFIQFGKKHKEKLKFHIKADIRKLAYGDEYHYLFQIIFDELYYNEETKTECQDIIEQMEDFMDANDFLLPEYTH